MNFGGGFENHSHTVCLFVLEFICVFVVSDNEQAQDETDMISEFVSIDEFGTLLGLKRQQMVATARRKNAFQRELTRDDRVWIEKAKERMIELRMC